MITGACHRTILYCLIIVLREEIKLGMRNKSLGKQPVLENSIRASCELLCCGDCLWSVAKIYFLLPALL